MAEHETETSEASIYRLACWEFENSFPVAVEKFDSELKRTGRVSATVEKSCVRFNDVCNVKFANVTLLQLRYGDSGCPLSLAVSPSLSLSLSLHKIMQ
jgi:hypothetical protein